MASGHRCFDMFAAHGGCQGRHGGGASGRDGNGEQRSANIVVVLSVATHGRDQAVAVIGVRWERRIEDEHPHGEMRIPRVKVAAPHALHLF
jgi:hypothetical protein